MKYPHTVEILSKRICNCYPNAPAILQAAEKNLFQQGQYSDIQFPAYLIWMLQELETFQDREQAGRWLGWVMRSLETLGIMSLQENHELIRTDKQPVNPHDPELMRAVAKVCLKESAPGVNETWG